MKAWYNAKEPQEQRIILILSVIVGLSLFYLLIWSPISETYQQKHKQVFARQQLLSWMEKTSQEIIRLKPQTNNQRNRSGGPLLSSIDRTIKAARLNQTMKRLEPQGNERVQIWFEKTAFDTLIQWLGKLDSTYGINIQSINVERLDQPGLVNARLVLKKG